MLTILIGFTVGLLVGLSGLGGGVVLLPLLIFVLHVPPIIAVGSGRFSLRLPRPVRGFFIGAKARSTGGWSDTSPRAAFRGPLREWGFSPTYARLTVTA